MVSISSISISSTKKEQRKKSSISVIPCCMEHGHWFVVHMLNGSWWIKTWFMNIMNHDKPIFQKSRTSARYSHVDLPSPSTMRPIRSMARTTGVWAPHVLTGCIEQTLLISCTRAEWFLNKIVPVSYFVGSVVLNWVGQTWTGLIRWTKPKPEA